VTGSNWNFILEQCLANGNNYDSHFPKIPFLRTWLVKISCIDDGERHTMRELKVRTKKLRLREPYA
jgi:hypothetical protein